MKETAGDLWDYEQSHWLCVTTNQGWSKSGSNIMGAGLAKQAANRFPNLPARYGAFCRMFPGAAKLYPYKRYTSWLLMYPTKALNPQTPYMSWRGKSSLELIERCAIELAKFGETSERPIAIPALGCQNGGLKVCDVLDILYKYLKSDDKFLFVHPQPLLFGQSPLPY